MSSYGRRSLPAWVPAPRPIETGPGLFSDLSGDAIAKEMKIAAMERKAKMEKEAMDEIVKIERERARLQEISDRNSDAMGLAPQKIQMYSPYDHIRRGPRGQVIRTEASW